MSLRRIRAPPSVVRFAVLVRHPFIVVGHDSRRPVLTRGKLFSGRRRRNCASCRYPGTRSWYFGSSSAPICLRFMVVRIRIDDFKSVPHGSAPPRKFAPVTAFCATAPGREGPIDALANPLRESKVVESSEPFPSAKYSAVAFCLRKNGRALSRTLRYTWPARDLEAYQRKQLGHRRTAAVRASYGPAIGLSALDQRLSDGCAFATAIFE